MMMWFMRAWAVLGAAAIAWVGYPIAKGRVLSVESTAAQRGERLAHELGCFACHGVGGIGGVMNPTASEGPGSSARQLGEEVPAFTEQTQMMYVKTTDDIREYILDGLPKRRREDARYLAKVQGAAIQMPAYRGRITDAQLEDLVAYLRATSGQLIPDDPKARLGGDLFVGLSCASCHGPLGTGGMPNPGSFKGYIPGFWGEDYDELVTSDDELRQWLSDGAIPRIAEHPIGGWFFKRQMVKMPAYGKLVTPDDIGALMAYVKWIRSDVWRDKLE